MHSLVETIDSLPLGLFKTFFYCERASIHKSNKSTVIFFHRATSGKHEPCYSLIAAYSTFHSAENVTRELNTVAHIEMIPSSLPFVNKNINSFLMGILSLPHVVLGMQLIVYFSSERKLTHSKNPQLSFFALGVCMRGKSASASEANMRISNSNSC